MKKLKKGLSLVLVLVMVLGLVGNAFAYSTTYNDDAQIKNKEAVAVLTDMGVIEGYGDGNFGPADNYTRAQAAKIVSELKLGVANAQALTATTTSFSDTKGHWAAAYIEYAAAKGIVAGYGDGKFGPDDALTREQWLKILLVALEYDPKVEKLQDSPDWAGNAVALAEKIGLISPADTKTAFNRDEAVKYAWNALWTGINGKKPEYVVTFMENGKQVTRRFTSYTDAKACTNNPGAVIRGVDTLGDDVFDLIETTEKFDVYGRPAHSYTYNCGAGYTSISANYVAAYTDIVTAATIRKDLGNTDAEITYYYENGQKVPTELMTQDTVNTELIGGKGTILEIYQDTPTQYHAVVINTFAYEVTPANVQAKYNKEFNVSVEAETLTGDTQSITVTINNTTGLKAGDVILFHVGDKDLPATGESSEAYASYKEAYNKFVEKTYWTVDGSEHTVSGVATTYVRLDGTNILEGPETYLARFIAYGKDAALSLFSTVKVYYDDYGNIIYVKAVAPADRLYDGIAYVQYVQSKVTPGFVPDLYDEGVPPTGSALAQIIDMEDDTVKIVNRSVINCGPDGWYLADQNAQPVGEQLGDVEAVEINDKDIRQGKSPVEAVGKFYYYYVQADGTYVFGDEIVETSKAKIPSNYHVDEYIDVATNKMGVTTQYEDRTYTNADTNTQLKIYTLVKGPDGVYGFNVPVGTVLKPDTFAGFRNFPNSFEKLGYVEDANRRNLDTVMATKIVQFAEPTMMYEYAFYVGKVERDQYRALDIEALPDGVDVLKFAVATEDGTKLILVTDDRMFGEELTEQSIYAIALVPGAVIPSLIDAQGPVDADIVEATVISVSGDGAYFVEDENGNTYEIPASVGVCDSKTGEAVTLTKGQTVNIWIVDIYDGDLDTGKDAVAFVTVDVPDTTGTHNSETDTNGDGEVNLEAGEAETETPETVDSTTDPIVD